MKKNFKRFVSIAIAFAMILLAIPTMEAKADQPIGVKFKNTEGWSSVYAYAWDEAENTLLGSWPGTDITATEAAGYYTAVLPEMDADSVNIIFSGGQSQPQTVDLKLDLTKGLEWWVVPNGYEGTKVTCATATSQADAEANQSATTPATKPTFPEVSSVKESPVIDGNKVTFYLECEGAGSIAVACSENNWSTTDWIMTKDEGNVYSYTCELAPNTYQYKFVVDGTYMADPVNPNTADDGFGGVNSTFEVKATADTTPENPTVTVSPVIDGNKVTFYYESSTATKVEVFGTMNEWAAGFEMTKDGNVFSYTCELDAGTYQYKFVIDGADWIMDPVNKNTLDDGTGNLNSSFEVTAALQKPDDATPGDTTPEDTSKEETTTENTTTEDASKDTEEEKDTQASDANKDDATTEGEPLSPGAIVTIAAVITIAVVGLAFGGYMFYMKKKNQ